LVLVKVRDSSDFTWAQTPVVKLAPEAPSQVGVGALDNLSHDTITNQYTLG